MAKIQLAPAFQKITSGEKNIEVKSLVLSDALDELEVKYPGIKSKIVGESNQILKYVTIFLGKEDVKYLDGLKTKIAPSDRVNILVAVAGG